MRRWIRPLVSVGHTARWSPGRASELETEVAQSPARIEGPTLPELEEIAREAGIDPALVRRAAEELDTPVAPDSPHVPRLGGVPLRIELDRVVPGRVSAEALESMLGTIQRATGDTGHPTVLRHSLSWRSTDSDRKRGTAKPVLNVSVTSAQGETRITGVRSRGSPGRDPGRWIPDNAGSAPA